MSKAKGSKGKTQKKPAAPAPKQQTAPQAPDISKPWCDTCKSMKDLKAEAKELKIRYFSRLKREELMEAVWCAREKGQGDAARLQEFERLGKERSDALWAAWRKKREQAG